MQFIKSLLSTLFVFVSAFSFSQTTYLPQGSKHNHFIDRLEIKSGRVSDINFSVDKPYSRKFAVELAMQQDSIMQSGDKSWSKQDAYNLRTLYINNAEWFKGDRSFIESRKPILKAFYKTKAHLLEHFGEDFYIALDPVFHYRQMKEADNDKNTFINSRGITVRGRIANKIGFAAQIVDNQERGPLFFQDWVNMYDATPGANFYKPFKTTGVDYLDGRGYFTFNVAKYVHFQIGYDKNFIGNGYRSLFLSDFGGNTLFVKLNTKIWKFQYQNLFMELVSKSKFSGNTLLPKKYAAMHHLSVNLTKWLNVGAFEGVIFGREDHFEFGYMNPIIFFRTIEGNLGSRDNALVGFDFKANAAKQFQFYGQLLLDELNIKELRKDKTWWGNKFGTQLGAKYIDAFTLPNLDLQLEWNSVRPFTYSHYDSVANYTHYNQPLAHPLGANFNEIVAIARYQPIGKLNLTGKLIYWKQGIDSSATSKNFGYNIFRSNGDRIGDYGYKTGDGVGTSGVNASLLAAYELKENLFIDLYILLRRYKNDLLNSKETTKLFGLGVRLNLFSREYDY